MMEKKVSERLSPSSADNPETVAINQNGIFLPMTSSARPAFKKQKSVMESVYKLLGISAVPTSREVGTLVLLGAMAILFIISITGFFVMWFTQFYDNTLVSQLVLSNNSAATDSWLNPPVNSYLKVHIFNYTNINRYLAGTDDKIQVVDLGPYTYEQFATKANVKFNANYTVTFNDHRDYKFRPDLSSGTPTDRVYVPNVPLLTAAVEVERMSFVPKFTATATLSLMDLDPYISLDVHSFLWGYDDAIVNLLRLTSTQYVPEKFGMLTNRNGTSRDTIQIYTGEGEGNLLKMGLVSQFNGKPKLDMWATDECNEIDGSDSSQFPPYLMENREDLNVFTQALCRKLPLEFTGEVDILDGIPVWRYSTPMNVFANPDENPENACFCGNPEACLPSGIFNGTQCYGAPIYPSFPHYFSGDPILYKDFEGIQPVPEKHQTFADIHPRLAFPLNGASRIQFNILVHKGTLLRNKLRRMEEGLFLPIIWLEVTSGDIKDDLRTLIFHSTFSVNAIQLVLKYGTLLICVTSFALIVVSFYYLGKIRDEEQLKAKEIESNSAELEVLNKVKIGYVEPI